jgi:membrane peptidoglycan carboxypeptidase
VSPHIPEHVQKSFLAAEDKRFYEHKGIDERGRKATKTYVTSDDGYTHIDADHTD